LQTGFFILKLIYRLADIMWDDWVQKVTGKKRKSKKRVTAPMREARSGTGILVNVQNTKRTEKFSAERMLARDKRLYTSDPQRTKINANWTKLLQKAMKKKK
jgi:hypothetical protein